MLAEYVRRHLRDACAELLFQDGYPASHTDPVAKATRSPDATHKVGRRRTPTREPCRTITSLLDELENRTRNTIRVNGT
ncbi:MAG TPA: IS1634 family transposase, partial [Solirubrobacteraceae bacterium]|nr:IS1634 family transposase [Solirubrobacteraceae bacterium]